jgi:hypothetical protein
LELFVGIFGNKKQQVEIELNEELFAAIKDIHGAGGFRQMMAPDPRIPWDEEAKQPLDIKGETWFTNDLAELKGGKVGEVWYPGLLIPEPSNPSDKYAVALYLIDNSNAVFKVGYIPGDIAKRVSTKISNLMVQQGQIIPIIAKILGGEPGKPNYGVRAFVKTNIIKF